MVCMVDLGTERVSSGARFVTLVDDAVNVSTHLHSQTYYTVLWKFELESLVAQLVRTILGSKTKQPRTGQEIDISVSQGSPTPKTYIVNRSKLQLTFD